MQIRISYYAILREQRGLDEETVRTDNSDLRQLFRDLERAWGFSLSEKHVRPAVNDEFCDWSRPLVDGDHVVFIPPVAGG
jgi:molybdopterin converting factor small subunit